MSVCGPFHHLTNSWPFPWRAMGGWGHLQHSAINLPQPEHLHPWRPRYRCPKHLPDRSHWAGARVFGLLRSLKVFVASTSPILIKHAESICLASSWGSDGELTQAGDWFINTDFSLWDHPDDDRSASGISKVTRKIHITRSRWTLMDSNMKNAG